MYIYCNTEVRLRDHCCHGKAVLTVLSVCLFSALLIQKQCTCTILYSPWPVWLYCTFPLYLINSTIFGKKEFKIKCVLIFSTTFVWTLLIARRIPRDITVNVQRSSHSCQILMKLEFCRQIFEKSWNVKFHENLSSKSRPVPCGDGETDRQAKATSHSL